MGESPAGLLYVVRTVTASLAFRETDDGWLVSAENVASGTSMRIPAEREYRLAAPPAPWPPRRGCPLIFIAADSEDSAQLPGLGMITSPVVHFEVRSLQ